MGSSDPAAALADELPRPILQFQLSNAITCPLMGVQDRFGSSAVEPDARERHILDLTGTGLPTARIQHQQSSVVRNLSFSNEAVLDTLWHDRLKKPLHPVLLIEISHDLDPFT